uniref:Uncharacterized protein n=1 Tax=Klebsiella pneumoniae TaxID=573 RepID=A0A8B0SV13_KLEPN|nr:hypothetical protein [Klebsiella pneumoniae]
MDGICHRHIRFLLELNQHTYLPVVNAEFDICVISCGKEWWCFRLVDVKSDERQEGMVARTAYRLNQSMGIAEQMVNMIRASAVRSVP